MAVIAVRQSTPRLSRRCRRGSRQHSLCPLFHRYRALVDRAGAEGADEPRRHPRRRISTASPSQASRSRPTPRVGLTQHLGLSPRWLDNIPMGGASAVVALRRAARAVEAGDASIVACVGGDANAVDSLPQAALVLLALRPGCELPLWLWRAERLLRAPDRPLHAGLWRDPRGLRQDLRRPARTTR